MNPLLGITSIVNKELRPLLRAPRSFWLLITALLAAGGVFFKCWLTTTSHAGNAADAAYFGRTIFFAVAVALLVALGLVSPILTATAIASERENNTLDLLLATGLSPWRILVGKLTASLAYQVVFVVCMLPVLTLTLLLGGVGADEIALVTLIILTTVLTYGMLGLAVSCRLRKAASALALTLLIVLSLALFICGGAGIFMNFHMLDGDTFQATFPLSPGATLLQMTEIMVRGQVQYFNRRGNSMPVTIGFVDLMKIGTFQAHLALQAVLFVGSWFVALRGLRRRGAERHATARKIIDDPALLAQRRKRFPYYLVDPLRRAQRIGDRQNPVYVKELRVGSLARPQVLLRLCYVGAILSIPFGIGFLNSERFAALRWLGLGLLAPLSLFILILAAGTLGREREEHTLDLLRATPLSAAAIVRAKFLAVMRFVCFLSLSMLVTPLVLMAWSWIPLTQFRKVFSQELAVITNPATIVLALAFTLSYAAFYTALGLYCSSRCRRNATAVVLSFVLAGGLSVTPFLARGLDQWAIELTTPHYGIQSMPQPPLRPGYDYSASSLHWAVSAGIERIGPVISPPFYFAVPDPDAGGTYQQQRVYKMYFPVQHRRDQWGKILLHASLILGLAWLLLHLTARRLPRLTR